MRILTDFREFSLIGQLYQLSRLYRLMKVVEIKSTPPIEIGLRNLYLRFKNEINHTYILKYT